ncbi:MAG: Npt1/Npt2 family nucleotide transporter [Candidatus Babeliales bacterium]
MSSNAWRFFRIFNTTDTYERLKVVLLAITFFLVIAAYTVVYDLKNAIFVSIVGKQYVPYAKMIGMFILIPAVLFYSFLVDRLQRHYLLYFYSITYALIGMACVYFIGHPTIGLPNTEASPWRLFGWFFYFLVEGFAPFVVSVFWAFANSINSPEGAKENYGILVTGSKMGGMMSAGLAWAWLVYRSSNSVACDAINHQILLGFFSFFMLSVAVMVYILIWKLPQRYLHGYEAVYRLEKKMEHEEQGNPGLFSGLKMLVQKPYILGIFGMVFFYEVLNSVLGYQRLEVTKTVASCVSDMSAEFYRQMFFMHLIGFFISVLGTNALLRRMGERFCLLLIPVASGLLLFYFWLTYTTNSLLWVFITLKSMNYAFAQPVRESLYIPTTKDVRFKSKSWVDAFGSKFARGMGSIINLLSDAVGQGWYFVFHGTIFGVLIGAWLGTALLLGNRYVKAIRRNEIIG